MCLGNAWLILSQVLALGDGSELQAFSEVNAHIVNHREVSRNVIAQKISLRLLLFGTS